MSNLSPFGLAYFGALAVILVVMSGTTMATLVERVRAPVKPVRSGLKRLTTALMVAFGVTSATLFVVQFLLIGDFSSALGVVGGVLFIPGAMGLGFPERRSIHALTIALATSFLMQGAQLRMFVEGSRFDHGGVPWRDWTFQLLMCGLSMAQIMLLGSTRGSDRPTPVDRPAV